MGDFATQVTVELNPEWHQLVARQLLPQAHRIARDAKEYIDGPDGAPVGRDPDPHPGALREASFARVAVDDGLAVELGVDLAEAKWGLFVIKGTSHSHANDYIGRAADHALAVQRARGAL